MYIAHILFQMIIELLKPKTSGRQSSYIFQSLLVTLHTGPGATSISLEGDQSRDVLTSVPVCHT